MEEEIIIPICWVRCHLALIPAFGRRRQAELCEIKPSLVYKVSFRQARAVGDPVKKRKKFPPLSIYIGPS